MPTQFSSSASTVRGLARAALCTACACLLAPVSIPIGPVSLTLGVFAILLAGALLPPALAALSACAYPAAGLCRSAGVRWLCRRPRCAVRYDRRLSAGLSHHGLAAVHGLRKDPQPWSPHGWGGTGKPVLLPAGHRLVHGCHRHGTVGVPLGLCDSLYPARPCKGLVCPLAGRAPALTPAA